MSYNNLVKERVKIKKEDERPRLVWDSKLKQYRPRRRPGPKPSLETRTIYRPRKRPGPKKKTTSVYEEKKKKISRFDRYKRALIVSTPFIVLISYAISREYNPNLTKEAKEKILKFVSKQFDLKKISQSKNYNSQKEAIEEMFRVTKKVSIKLAKRWKISILPFIEKMMKFITSPNFNAIILWLERSRLNVDTTGIRAIQSGWGVIQSFFPEKYKPADIYMYPPQDPILLNKTIEIATPAEATTAVPTLVRSINPEPVIIPSETSVPLTRQPTIPIEVKVNPLGSPANVKDMQLEYQNQVNPLSSPTDAKDMQLEYQNQVNPLGSPTDAKDMQLEYQNQVNPLGSPTDASEMQLEYQNQVNPLGSPPSVSEMREEYKQTIPDPPNISESDYNKLTQHSKPYIYKKKPRGIPPLGITKPTPEKIPTIYKSTIPVQSTPNANANAIRVLNSVSKFLEHISPIQKQPNVIIPNPPPVQRVLFPEKEATIPIEIEKEKEKNEDKTITEKINEAALKEVNKQVIKQVTTKPKPTTNIKIHDKVSIVKQPLNLKKKSSATVIPKTPQRYKEKRIYKTPQQNVKVITPNKVNQLYKTPQPREKINPQKKETRIIKAPPRQHEKKFIPTTKNIYKIRQRYKEKRMHKSQPHRVRGNIPHSREEKEKKPPRNETRIIKVSTPRRTEKPMIKDMRIVESSRPRRTEKPMIKEMRIVKSTPDKKKKNKRKKKQ